ncbi:MAG TPA: VTT domain-containing protein [Candidatus Paceibacterota bacterium]|nr:VTT domain-containing protein [Candidatus Paceibacterota bacterium]
METIFISHLYLFLIPLAIIEGSLLAIVCGILGSLGVLNPFIAYSILIVGDLLPDIVYYWIGRYVATQPIVRRFATRVRLIRENFLSLERLWREKPFFTLTTAKLSYGIAPPFIVSAGASNIPFYRFLFYSLVVSTIFLGTLECIGYVVAETYGFIHITKSLAPLFIGLFGFLCLVVLMGALRAARKQLRFSGNIESNLIEH